MTGSAPPRSSALRQAILALATTVLFLFLAEGALRLVLPARWSAGNALNRDPLNADLLWIPDALTRTANGRQIVAHPFRDPGDVPKTPPRGTVRVLCLGGSVTAGWPLAPDVAYPRRLEQALAAKGAAPCRIEVLNAGYPGTDSYLGRYFLNAVGRSYRPDVVTAHYGVNDYASSLSFGQFVSEPRYVAMHRATEASPLARAIRAAVGRSRLADATRRSFFALAVRLSRTQALGDPRRGLFPPRVPPEETERALRGIVAAGQADGFETVLVFETNVYTDYARMADDLQAPYWAAFQRVARDTGARLVTPDTVLNGRERPRSAYFLDGCHMTEDGLRLFADRLADDLVREGVIARAVRRARARDGE